MPKCEKCGKTVRFFHNILLSIRYGSKEDYLKDMCEDCRLKAYHKRWNKKHIENDPIMDMLR